MASNVDQTGWQKHGLRLPMELHAAVHASAKASGRSYNAEVIHILGEATMARSNLRDKFAGIALPIASEVNKLGHVDGWDGIAKIAYDIADAMIRARAAGMTGEAERG